MNALTTLTHEEMMAVSGGDGTQTIIGNGAGLVIGGIVGVLAGGGTLGTLIGGAVAFGVAETINNLPVDAVASAATTAAGVDSDPGSFDGGWYN